MKITYRRSIQHESSIDMAKMMNIVDENPTQHISEPCVCTEYSGEDLLKPE